MPQAKKKKFKMDRVIENGCTAPITSHLGYAPVHTVVIVSEIFTMIAIGNNIKL